MNKFLKPIEKNNSLDVETLTENLIYLENNDLPQIEESINRRFTNIIGGRFSLCLELSHIKKNKLFLNLKFKTFKEYLNSGRIKMPYKTSEQYAIMGDIFFFYKDKLQALKFSEEQGLEKLKLLPKAIKNLGEEEAFNHLMQGSFREFKEAINSGKTQAELANQSIKSLLYIAKILNQSGFFEEVKPHLVALEKILKNLKLI